MANGRMTLDLHEDSLERDTNDKGGWTRQDLQGNIMPEDNMHEEVI